MMSLPRRLLAAAALVALTASSAQAHGLIGKRFFPATLAIDDPFVADELSLPTISHIKLRGDEESPPTRETAISGEFSKRLSRDFGFSLSGTYKTLDPDEGSQKTGFDNMEVGVKYVFFKSDPHETLLSLGVDWDVGGTGSKKVGAESFDTVTPTLFFGKGFGDLPDSLDYLKPFAVTGAIGVAIPSRKFNKIRETEDDGTVTTEKEKTPTVVTWGFTFQYNLQYLQSYVRDVGLPEPFSRMIPIVELSLETPTNAPNSNRTTGTVNPGIIWFGKYVQLGIEAIVPINTASGKNVGVLGQVHFYLDDILPQVFSWTPFSGVLGPTQPR
jgi:hypothetical protein